MGSKGKQTDKSRYPSIYSPETFVTAAQYITELLFQKKAKYEKKELPLKFWKNSEYSKQFVRWQRQANKLVKEYSGNAIIAALKDPKSGLRWSLHGEFLLNLIKEHHQKILEQEKNRANLEPIVVAEGESFRESKPGIIDKLKELD